MMPAQLVGCPAVFKVGLDGARAAPLANVPPIESGRLRTPPGAASPPKIDKRPGSVISPESKKVVSSPLSSPNAPMPRSPWIGRKFGGPCHTLGTLIIARYLLLFASAGSIL